MADDATPALITPIPLWAARLLLLYCVPAEPDDPGRQAKAAMSIRWHEAAFAEANNLLYAWSRCNPRGSGRSEFVIWSYESFQDPSSSSRTHDSPAD